MKNSRCLFLLYLILVIGCTYSKVDNKSNVITKDGNGNILSDINYINDSILNGVARFYYPNGMIKEEINYSNGVKEGWDITYYSNGSVESKIQYKNGSREGMTYWYYPNQNLKEKSNWLNNKQFGHSYFYYENGNLETFCSFDFSGNNRYLIKCDINGIKIREEGTIIGQFLLEGNFDSVPINKPISAKISVTIPPKANISVIIGELKDSRLIEIDTLLVENNIATYNRKFKKIGKYSLITIGEARDLNGEILTSDSNYTEIIVVK